MLKKTITYEDFNGDEVTEDFFFHLSKAELVELELSYKGGLSEALKRIIAAEDGKVLIAEFKNILLSAYGQKSEDGKRFVKTQELRDEFESTEAYSVLFMEILTETEKAIEFINGVIPANLAEEAAKVARADLKVVEEETPEIEKPEEKPGPVIVTRADILKMSQEELNALPQRVMAGEAKLEE